MKKFILGFWLVSLSACSLNADYVAADRHTWERMRPVIEMGIRAQAIQDQEAYQLLDDTWKKRWQAGEKYNESN